MHPPGLLQHYLQQPKRWKQLKCPSIDEWCGVHPYIHKELKEDVDKQENDQCTICITIKR